MHDRHPRILALAITLCALAAAPAAGYEGIDRWNNTATDGSTGPKGTPVTVTWSFAPDGTNVPSTPSNLINFLDAYFGPGDGGADLTLRPWFTLFAQSFDRLAQVSGVTYVYEPHDDAAQFASVTRGALGVRGDVRIGGRSYGSGDLTLATNHYPDYSEMMINTDQSSYLSNPSNNYRPLRNMLMHELMHGLGLGHVDSSDSRFLIEPILGTSFDGPQLDDILGLQRLYGDALEKNGGNDVPFNATALGALAPGSPLTRGTLGDSTVVAGTATDFLSIDGATDVDYFQFTVAEAQSVSLNLTPKGATYMVAPSGNSQSQFNAKALSNLSLALYSAEGGGVQLGATANANGVGLGESIVRELNPGSYWARVTGAQDDVQLYQLAISGTLITPELLTWVGNQSSQWNVATTANFHNGTSADVFRNGDQVVFAAGAQTTQVTVAQPVAPASMAVTSAADYLFQGAGITTSLLTVSGGGTVTLANQNNALAAVDVQAGKLRITGTNNAPFAGTVHIAAQAELELVGAQALASSAQLTGRGRVIGDVAMPGTIAPGESMGLLSIAGNLTLAGSSTVAIELGGELLGSQYDALAVSGDVALAGTLAVSLVNGFQPILGESFSVLMYDGARTGQFADVQLPQLGVGLLWNSVYTANALLLSVSAAVAHAPADFNRDGYVNAADLAIWRQGVGLTNATQLQGDANGDGSVNGADFLVWQLGLNDPGATHNATPEVPEPTGAALTAIGLAALARKRRRRQVR
jgi:MYXO-CTERM domain-containing protein